MKSLKMAAPHADRRIGSAIAAGTFIDHQHLVRERELDDLKWFAYRFMAPLDATRIFYDEYLPARRAYVEREIDNELSPRLKEKRFASLNEKEFTQAWMARQRADELGWPYAEYIAFSMRFRSRRAGNIRAKYAPQINQLHYTETSEAAWEAAAQREMGDRLIFAARNLAQVPELRADNYRGWPAQKDMRSLVAKFYSNAANWEVAVHKWCYDFPIMTLSSFRRQIPPETMQRIISNLRSEAPTVDAVPLAAPDFRPSCFAVPRAHEAVPKCQACAFASACRAASAEVTETIRSTAGDEDPRRARRRELGAARQRRLKEKQMRDAAAWQNVAPEVLTLS